MEKHSSESNIRTRPCRTTPTSTLLNIPSPLFPDWACIIVTSEMPYHIGKRITQASWTDGKEAGVSLAQVRTRWCNTFVQHLPYNSLLNGSHQCIKKELMLVSYP